MSNSGLAQFSNVALVLAIIVYALAMVAYAFDFAFSKRRAKAAGASASAVQKEPVLVGAGAADLGGMSFAADPGGPSELADLSEQQAAQAEHAGSGGETAVPGAPYRESSSRWPSGLWLRSAFALTCFGLLLQISSITARGIDEHRVPWGNMYEFVLTVTFIGVAAWLVVLWKRPSLRKLGLMPAAETGWRALLDGCG